MKIITVLIFCLFYGEIYAQNLDGQVKYQQILNLNPELNYDNLGVSATLYFCGKKSSFVSNIIDKTEETADSLKMVKAKKNIVTSNKNVQSDSIGERINKDFTKNKILKRILLLKRAFLLEDTFPTFNWVLHNENKTFGNITCQKATIYYKGRNYIAWFAPSIPVNNGPWKFQGLPGLILEIYDIEKEVQFLFKSLSIPDNICNKIDVVLTGNNITANELEKMKTEEDEQLKRNIESKVPKGVTINISFKKAAQIEKEEKKD
jgi:GLPGLI family protein